MNQIQIVEQLQSWMQNFVEQPHPNLGQWSPCPYARAARLSDKVSIKFCIPFEFEDLIRESLATLEQKDVVIICFDHHLITAPELQKFVRRVNQLLMPVDYVILEDHPDAEEILNGVKMNFGECGLLLFQKLSKLNSASEMLKAKGYYDTWPKENLDDVVTWRSNEVLQN